MIIPHSGKDQNSHLKSGREGNEVNDFENKCGILYRFSLKMITFAT